MRLNRWDGNVNHLSWEERLLVTHGTLGPSGCSKKEDLLGILIGEPVMERMLDFMLDVWELRFLSHLGVIICVYICLHPWDTGEGFMTPAS